MPKFLALSKDPSGEMISVNVDKIVFYERDPGSTYTMVRMEDGTDLAVTETPDRLQISDRTWIGLTAHPLRPNNRRRRSHLPHCSAHGLRKASAEQTVLQTEPRNGARSQNRTLTVTVPSVPAAIRRIALLIRDLSLVSLGGSSDLAVPGRSDVGAHKEFSDQYARVGAIPAPLTTWHDHPDEATHIIRQENRKIL
jgi:hypothetical protein